MRPQSTPHRQRCRDVGYANHEDRWPTDGYELTRAAAMTASAEAG
jgi:hypothetical protein